MLKFEMSASNSIRIAFQSKVRSSSKRGNNFVKSKAIRQAGGVLKKIIIKLKKIYEKV